MSEPTPAELEKLREEITAIDERLLEMVRRRIEIAHIIGAVKEREGLPTLDPRREARVVRRASEIARELDLPAEEVRQIFWAIVGMTRRVQQEKRGS